MIVSSSFIHHCVLSYVEAILNQALLHALVPDTWEVEVRGSLKTSWATQGNCLKSRSREWIYSNIHCGFHLYFHNNFIEPLLFICYYIISLVVLAHLCGDDILFVIY